MGGEKLRTGNWELGIGRLEGWLSLGGEAGMIPKVPMYHSGHWSGSLKGCSLVGLVL